MKSHINYCTCKYGGSPSQYHDNCISCNRLIKTIYVKYDELEEKLKILTNPNLLTNYIKLKELVEKIADDGIYVEEDIQETCIQTLKELN